MYTVVVFCRFVQFVRITSIIFGFFTLTYDFILTLTHIHTLAHMTHTHKEIHYAHTYSDIHDTHIHTYIHTYIHNNNNNSWS